MKVSSQGLEKNRLLAQLRPADLQRLTENVVLVDLSFGEVLHQYGESMKYVYFPIDALVSLLAMCGERETLEIDAIGAEGIVGISIALGGTISPVRSVVIKAGTAVRMNVAAFRQECERSPDFQALLNHTADTLLARSMQVAACCRSHVLEARLARALLLIRDRVQSDEFHMTHEIFSQTLGVRRVGVTKAASTLQENKLISYSRGAIKILDAAGLERASCGCYGVVNRIANEE